MSRLERAMRPLHDEHQRVCHDDAERETRLGQRILERAIQAHQGPLPEHLHLAARFHYPISPGFWRSAQWRLLREAGYSLPESRRIVNLMETYRCLDGDPEVRFLMEHTGHTLISDGIIPRSDPMWPYEIGRIYKYLSPPLQDAVAAVDASLRPSRSRREPPMAIHSQILGTSVDVEDPWYVGFPNVYLPVLGHAVELSLEDEEIARSIDRLDAALRVWLALGEKERAVLTEKIVAYKHLVGEACGDRTPHISAPEKVWDHVDLNWGTVESRKDGFRLKISGDCEWEPEHGLMITIGEDGSILEIGEVG